jgi:biotin synthase
MSNNIINFTIGDKRQNWTLDEVDNLLKFSFNDLLFHAHSTHRQNFNQNEIQTSTLLSIKTGGCPENCKYCPQSAHYNTGLEKEGLMECQEILTKAQEAKAKGSSRFCMGAAWRNLNDRNVEEICNIVSEVKKTGLETCMTLGMITDKQAKKLKEAGLDYYNHNIDSSEEFYEKIISTRKYSDRIETLNNVANNDINVCCGGILGMGESREDRIKMLLTLTNKLQHPKSVPINLLERTAGTPLENAQDFDVFEFIRTIALARIMLPKSYVRLSAGRKNLSKEAQSLCFFAGANSIFYGEKLLTQKNPELDTDQELFNNLNLTIAS